MAAGQSRAGSKTGGVWLTYRSSKGRLKPFSDGLHPPTENPAKPVIIDSETREYRTRFRKTNRMAVNFAGHYVVSSFGCGTGSCTSYIMTDVKTGKGSFVPFGGVAQCLPSPGEDREPLYPDVSFQAGSRLMVVSGTTFTEDDDKCLVRYYVEQNGKLKLVHSKPYK